MPTRLAFIFQASPRDDRVHVHIIDGSRRRRMTRGNLQHLAMAAAPDGRWIAFARYDLGTGRRTVHVISPDGRRTKRLQGSDLFEPRPWSPDGKWLLTRRARAVIVVSPDTGKARRLPLKPGALADILNGAGEIVWSPDGRRVALSRVGHDRSTIEIVLLRTGRSTRVVSGSRDVYLTAPIWLRDGRRLVFAKDDQNDELDGLWRINVNGQGEQRLVDGELELQGSPIERAPSADRILFTTYGEATGDLRVEVVNADGTGRRVLARQPAPEPPDRDRARHCCLGPTWSPDGRRIAYLRSWTPDWAGIWVMNANGGGKRRLTSTGWASLLNWLPARKAR